MQASFRAGTKAILYGTLVQRGRAWETANMGNRTTSITRMPEAGCKACHGLGSVRMTIHFYAGDQEFDAPCWECFGNDQKISFPRPQPTDN